MGLDFSHCEAHWSYFGFMAFRKRLAAQIDVDLDDMVGFGGDTEWGSPLDDPIIDLLNHSDCEDDLSPRQCAAIAPRLREMVTGWPDDYDKQNALLLAVGMEEAARKNERLKFH